MEETRTSKLPFRLSTAVLFVAGLFVGSMAYTGTLVYTPLVLVLAVLSVLLKRYDR
jgi:hypothetical protein